MIKTYSPEEPQFNHYTFLAVLSSIAMVFVVSYFYGLLMAVSPLIYINFFITVAFGTVIGIGIRILSKLFKITSKKVVIGIVLIGGLLAVYFSWVAYLLYFFSEDSLTDSYFIRPELVFQPANVLGILTEVNKHGLWEFMRVPFKGWALTLIWIIEALLIVIGPVLLILRQPTSPFSAKHKKWYKKFVLEKDFKSISFRKEFLSILEKGPIQAIDALDNGRATHFARISVYFLPLENEQYLSVENISTDRGGKREKRDSVIHLMHITKNEAKNLIEKYHGQKAFIFDY